MKPLFFQHLKYPNQLKKSIAFSGVPSLHIKEPQNPDEAQKFIAHKRPDFVLCAAKSESTRTVSIFWNQLIRTWPKTRIHLIRFVFFDILLRNA